jgi:UDP:flavonoid glycosyltransferase YjiC (YdhE family)
MISKQSPVLLFAGVPADGHFNPVFSIASHLRGKGYNVAFLTSPTYKGKVESAGIEWFHMDDVMTPEFFAGFGKIMQMPFGVERMGEEIPLAFVKPLPARVAHFEAALVSLRERDPTRQVIVLEDIFNWCIYTFKHGRPLPKGLDTLPKSIGIGVTPLLLDSQDTGPTWMGMPPDSTPSGKLRNAALLKLFREGPSKKLLDELTKGYESLGADMSGPKAEGIFNSWYTANDSFLQLCSPSMEYERSDLPSTIEFVGVLDGDAPKANLVYPSWWSDISEAKDNGNQVVFVAQGTINFDYTELVIPTIEAMAEQKNVIVVVVLCMRDAVLPAEVKVPSNVRVVDFFPYDVILRYADVFVSNVGYGSFGHAVRNGVPVLAAGLSQEKLETAQRVQTSGMGVNLETQRPSPKQVLAGVNKILGSPLYKKAAMAIQKENKQLNALAAIERKVNEMTL